MLILLLFYECCSSEYSDQNDVLDDRPCNISTPTQMVELKFSSHTVKNGKLMISSFGLVIQARLSFQSTLSALMAIIGD